VLAENPLLFQQHAPCPSIGTPILPKLSIPIPAIVVDGSNLAAYSPLAFASKIQVWILVALLACILRVDAKNNHA
jgi:hypothetical protein